MKGRGKGPVAVEAGRGRTLHAPKTQAWKAKPQNPPRSARSAVAVAFRAVGAHSDTSLMMCGGGFPTIKRALFGVQRSLARGGILHVYWTCATPYIQALSHRARGSSNPQCPEASARYKKAEGLGLSKGRAARVRWGGGFLSFLACR